MKRILLVAIFVFGFAGGATAAKITEYVALVSGALETLGFEAQYPRGQIGAPPTFKIDSKVVKKLQGMQGRTIHMDNDGSITVK